MTSDSTNSVAIYTLTWSKLKGVATFTKGAKYKG